MKIAIEGCAHGELEKIYDLIESIEQKENIKIDVLICCGDFQSTRNLEDLETMAVPKKYREMCSFYKYYSGEKVAPILTIFVGGNHEASNYLQELPYGGWVAPKIYYLGYANVININGVRIGGISGIYNGKDYFRGHYEFAPYTESTKRSVYHVRQLEVFRLKQLKEPIDIFLSHDWPRGVYNYGNANQLVRFKPHFKQEIEDNRLGSPPSEDLLNHLKPDYWFAAHLHCKFSAIIPHENDKVTKFLALDKCLPKRRFLQILDIGSKPVVDQQVKVEYDAEWLAILLLTNHLLAVKNCQVYMPGPNGSERYNFTPTEQEREHIQKKFEYDLSVPENFRRTVESYNIDMDKSESLIAEPKSQINPQTVLFCDTLGIDDPLMLAMTMCGKELNFSSTFEESDSSFCVDNDSSYNSSYGTSSPLKRPAITSVLPKPVCVENSNQDELFIDDDEPEVNRTLDHNRSDSSNIIIPSPEEVNVSVDADSNVAAKIPPIKKFKRRNQSIYAATEVD